MSQYYLQDQLSDKRVCETNSLSTNQNFNEGNSQMQLNYSCREGETKRRILLELNPMDELNQRNDDFSDLNRSQTIENALAVSYLNNLNNNNQNINNLSQLNNKSNNFINLDQNKSGFNEGPSNLDPSKGLLTPNQLQNPVPDYVNIHNKYLQPSIQRIELDEILQLPHQRSGDKIPSINNTNLLKSMDTFLPHSRSDALEGERNNKKLTTQDQLHLNTHVDHKSEEGKLTPNKLVSRNHLTSTSRMGDGVMGVSQQRRKSKKMSYFLLFKRTNLVKRFVNNIKNKATSYIFRRFQSKQFEILEDTASDYQYYERKGLIIHNAVYKRGMIMENRREIFKKFIKTDAKIDMATLLIYILSQASEQFNILEYVITVKIIQVIRSFKNLFHKFDRQMKYSALAKIITLFIIILTFSHTQATVFVRIGLYEIDNYQNSWIKLIAAEPTNTQIYIASIYWSIITMATIGYGDLHPVTDMSLISCGIYGYALNQIGQIVDSIEKKTEQFNKDMQILNRQMNQRSLNSRLQHKVRKYFEYLHKDNQVDDDKANQMIANLPQSMKQNILFDINHKILYSQKSFSLNFSKPFLDLLALEMKTLKLGPEIDLFSRDDTDDRCYFILKGQVEIYINLSNRQKTCYILKKGDMFGEIEFLCQHQRIKSAKTLNVVTLLYIDYKDFIRCIKNFDEDFQKYSMIKDKGGLYNNLEGLDRKCLSCKKFNHQFVSCPQLQYWPNMDKLIYDCNKSEFQLRSQETQRKDRNKHNVLKELYTMQKMCHQINQSNYDEEEEMENEENEENEFSYNQQSKQIESFGFKETAGGGGLNQIKFAHQQSLFEEGTEIPSISNINVASASMNPYTPVVGGNKSKTISFGETDVFKREGTRKVTKKLSIKKEKKRNTFILTNVNVPYDEELMSPSKKHKIVLDGSQIDILAGYTQALQLQPTLNSLTHINLLNPQPQQLNSVGNQSQFSFQNSKATIQMQQQQSTGQQPLTAQASISLIPSQQNQISNLLASNNLETNNTKDSNQHQQHMPQIELDCHRTFSKLELNHTNSKNTKSFNEGNGLNGHSDRYIFFHDETFDAVRTFKIYFPQNNVGNVLKRYQRFMKQTSSMYQPILKKKKLNRY